MRQQQQRCFGCGKDNVPLFRERNKGRIFCGVSCQEIGASWWLDFKRLNKVTVDGEEYEQDPQFVWNLINQSGMTVQEIVADFLNYDDFVDVFHREGKRDPVTDQRAFKQDTRFNNVPKHNETLKKMLSWLDNNPYFTKNFNAKHFFHNMIMYMIEDPKLYANAAPIFNHLLTLNNYDPAYEELRQACVRRNVVVVTRMLQSKRFPLVQYGSSFSIRIEVEICELGYTEIVALLLQYPNADPGAQDNLAIRQASVKGHTEVVALLLNHPRVSPIAYANYAIKMASQYGRTQVVALLLQDKRSDPATNDNVCIRVAAESGHLGVVALLLQDERVDPSAKDNAAIRLAASNGHADVVALLLQDERVDPSTDDNYAIRRAAAKGHVKVVYMLLEDARTDPSANDDYAIRWASLMGQTEVIMLLLQDDRVDRSVEQDLPFRKASEKNNLKLVALLLQDRRVDPSAVDNYAIRLASENGHVEIVKLLLQNPLVNPSANNNYAIRWASKEDHAEVVALLLQDPRVLRSMTSDQFETLRQENPTMKNEIDAAQASSSRLKTTEGVLQEEGEGPLKRLKERINLFSI